MDDSFSKMCSLTDASKSDRQGFVKKVYGILATQLVVTFGFVALAKSNPEIEYWLVNSWMLFYPVLFLQIAISCVISCCTSVARRTPHNYILLTCFTLCWTYLIGFICAFYPAEIVLSAAGMTAMISVAISIFACVTDFDFTEACGPFICMGLLLVMCVSLICSILSMIFFTFAQAWYPWACGLCVIIYGLFLLCDTQMIVGGGRYELSIDDYVLGAMMLYIDIIMLFLKLLEIFGRR